MRVGVLVVVWPRAESRWVGLVGEEGDLPVLVVYGLAMLAAGGEEPMPGA